MKLQDELNYRKREIHTDSYSLSVGELISLYENREIELHPEFQRFFRWSQAQKTRFIESLLIGFPLPHIFVSQRDDGSWDVVDGLQRLSTIYEFVGVLRDENGNTYPPLVLERGDSLISLEGKKWNDLSDVENSLDQTQRLLIKRTKMDIAILRQESDPMAKYELFYRLNTGGSIATDQEIRNCLLIMSNPDFYRWLRELSQYDIFQSCISLSDKARSEQYDLELLLRFIVFRSMDEDSLNRMPYPDMSELITHYAIEFSEKSTFDRKAEEIAFRTTFTVLSEQLEFNSFRKYDHQKGKFVGGFLISAFEAVALGLGFHYESVAGSSIDVAERVKQLWLDPKFTSPTGGSSRKRAQTIIPIGRELFKV
jgi:Protein of unknown function DUF262